MGGKANANHDRFIVYCWGHLGVQKFSSYLLFCVCAAWRKSIWQLSALRKLQIPDGRGHKIIMRLSPDEKWAVVVMVMKAGREFNQDSPVHLGNWNHIFCLLLSNWTNQNVYTDLQDSFLIVLRDFSIHTKSWRNTEGNCGGNVLSHWFYYWFSGFTDENDWPFITVFTWIHILLICVL